MDNQLIPDSDFSYSPTNQIGLGGFGLVFRGNNIKDNSPVAVKIVRKQFIENMHLEAKILRAEQFYNKNLRHENIVNCYGCYQDDKYYYFVQEYCNHGNLKEYLDKKIKAKEYIKEKEALNIFKDILNGYIYLKKDGMKLHRDLKPENIMIKDGKYKINDYDGIKYQIHQESKHDFSLALGTPYYQSPQALLGEILLDEKSDIWSMGIILYEILFLEKPFKSLHPTVLLDEINDKYDSLIMNLSKNDTISYETKLLIIDMLNQDAKSRISIDDITQNFKQLIYGEPIKSDNPNNMDNEKIYKLIEDKIKDYLVKFSEIVIKIQEFHVDPIEKCFSQLESHALCFLLTKIILIKYRIIFKLLEKYEYPTNIEDIIDQDWLHILDISSINTLKLFDLWKESKIIHKVENFYYTYIERLDDNKVHDQFDQLYKDIVKLIEDTQTDEISIKMAYRCLNELCQGREAMIEKMEAPLQSKWSIENVIKLIHDFNGNCLL